MIKRIALMLVLCSVLTVFGGCAGKNENKDTESVVSLAPITVPQSIAVTKVDADEEWVYEADGFKGKPFHIPQFNVKAKGIDELNKKLVDTFGEYSKKSAVRNIHYTSYVKDLVLSVYVEIVDNGWFKQGYVYNLSLGDGSLIRDARTMAAYCGLSDEEYRIAAATAVTIEYSSLFASFSDSNGTQFKENLEKNQSKEMTDTYKPYINERGELSFCGQMYGMDGTLRGFSSTSAESNGMVF